jgi:hypothetical protein
MMHKQVIPSLVRRNKTKTLLLVKPFYCPGAHNSLLRDGLVPSITLSLQDSFWDSAGGRCPIPINLFK